MNEGLMARTWADFRLHWRGALAFHLLMQLTGIAIFTPLATWLGRRIVLASGEPVISNFDIAAFVLSPAGVTFVLVIAALAIAVLLAEFAGQSWIAGHAIARRPTTLAATIAYVIAKPATVDRAGRTRVSAARRCWSCPFLPLRQSPG